MNIHTTSAFSREQSVTIVAIDLSEKELWPLLNGVNDRCDVVCIHYLQTASVDAIIALTPDLVLINVINLAIKGYQLCQAIRTCSALADISIVLIGDEISSSHRLMALNYGSNEYFSLPLQLEGNLAKLKLLLQMNSLVRQLKRHNLKLQQKIQEKDQQLKQQQAIQNDLVRSNQTLEKMAFVDALTQVANRRGFDTSLKKLWSLACHRQQALSLILCDVDFFKAYNDIYGHQAGDMCLQMIARMLKQAKVSTAQVIARYGGEEFAILLPWPEAIQAEKMAWQIQTDIAAARWPHHGATCHYPFVSISMGICTLVPQPFISAGDLIRQADEALYAAKTDGRNQIRTATNDWSGSALRPQGQRPKKYPSILPHKTLNVRASTQDGSAWVSCV